MEAGASSKADLKHNALSHQEKLALTGRLLRRLLTTLADHQAAPASMLDLKAALREQLFLLVALACLARRNLMPAALENTWAGSFIVKLCPDRRLSVDASRFASRLTALCQPVRSFQAAPACTRQLTAILSDPDLEPLVSDPLLPGWAHQLLNRRPRKVVTGLSRSANPQSARARDVSPANLPDLTQWFTPGWISGFLISETLGKHRSPEIRQNVTLFDPACGAGHVLVEALIQLFRAFADSSSAPYEVALASILRDQLFGCDIDPAMVDLSGFSLYLACRDLGPVTDLPLPNLFHFGLGKTADSDLAAIGSLWLGSDEIPGTVRISGPAPSSPLARSPLRRKFTAVVTNPPYLSHRLMPPALSSFLKSHYHSARFDLYAAFISLSSRLLEEGGRLGLICQQSFMTVQRYKPLREELIADCQIESLVQLGPGSFGSGAGEKINTAIIVARRAGKGSADHHMRCWRILNPDQKGKAEREGITALPSQQISQHHFAPISGAPFSFWCPPELARLFRLYPPLESSDSAIACTNGLFTCNNELFVKAHWQVPPEETSHYVPYDKGGGHKWYRTTPYRLHWQANGQAIREYRLAQGQSASLPGERFYFQPGVTYSYIGTKRFKARLLSPGSVFDIASSAVFSKRIDPLYLVGFLNSSLIRFLLGVLNPTINFQIGDLRRLPFASPDLSCQSTVAQAAGQAVQLAKELESFALESPCFEGPALLRYGSAAADRQSLELSYRAHLSRLKEINQVEAACQAAIDEQIFHLYEVPAQVRTTIASDPWVENGRGPLSRLPSYRQSLAELITFLNGAAAGRWKALYSHLAVPAEPAALAASLTRPLSCPRFNQPFT